MNPSVILAYHSLDRSGSVISVAPERFERQMEFLAGSGIPVMPLGRIRETAGAVALTFDDGFENFTAFALPVLERLHLPASVFVVTGHCGGWNDWPSQSAGIPRLRLMGWSDVRRLPESGISVGGHTCSHPNLAAIPMEDAGREVRDSRRELEHRLGRAVNEFAYPYGASTAAVRQLVRDEIGTACGTAQEFLSSRSDAWNLPRIDAYYLRPQGVFENLFNPLGRGYIGLRRAARGLRALAAG